MESAGSGGATPPQNAHNTKAKALRGRRAGDRVLFYADKGFIAQERILPVFHNPAAARSIWGTDRTGQTFEHIMALDEVEEFVPPVPAEPVLARLGLTLPLRSTP